MNAGRYVGASVVVFIVRTVLNTGFYGFLMHGEYDAVNAAHPGLFREVIPNMMSYIVINFVIAMTAAITIPTAEL